MELKLTREIIEECAHQGQCDDDVRYWVQQPIIESQLSQLSEEFVARVVQSYGGNLDSHESNLESLLWVACWDMKESDEFKDKRRKNFYAYLAP